MPSKHHRLGTQKKKRHKIGGGNDGDAGKFEVGKSQIFLGIIPFLVFLFLFFPKKMERKLGCLEEKEEREVARKEGEGMID